MGKEEKTGQTLENNDNPAGANTSNTTENPSVTEENKDFQPNYNIRNAKITDVKFINSFATDGKKVSEALSHVVKLAQRPEQNDVTLKENECIITVSKHLLDFTTEASGTTQQSIDYVFEVVQAVTPALEEFAIDEDKTPLDTLQRLFSALKEEKETSAKLRLQIENSKPEERKANELFVVFDEKTGENIRKVRPFIAKKGYLQYEQGNHQDFINKLVNHAVNKVLRIDFDNIINPL